MVLRCNRCKFSRLPHRFVARVVVETDIWTDKCRYDDPMAMEKDDGCLRYVAPGRCIVVGVSAFRGFVAGIFNGTGNLFDSAFFGTRKC